jgi:hypothetical protein
LLRVSSPREVALAARVFQSLGMRLLLLLTHPLLQPLAVLDQADDEMSAGRIRKVRFRVAQLAQRIMDVPRHRIGEFRHQFADSAGSEKFSIEADDFRIRIAHRSNGGGYLEPQNRMRRGGTKGAAGSMAALLFYCARQLSGRLSLRPHAYRIEVPQAAAHRCPTSFCERNLACAPSEPPQSAWWP